MKLLLVWGVSLHDCLIASAWARNLSLGNHLGFGALTGQVTPGAVFDNFIGLPPLAYPAIRIFSPAGFS